MNRSVIEFLKRPESEEQMYEEMNRMAEGGGDDKDGDEDNIIEELNSKMVLQTAALDDTPKQDASQTDEVPAVASTTTSQDENKMLDDLLDDLIKNE
jgi:hypothetical protein